VLGEALAPDKSETARYIEEVCTELRGLAEQSGSRVLVHLLGMTILQAQRDRRETLLGDGNNTDEEI
jgi:hypothetical protein